MKIFNKENKSNKSNHKQKLKEVRLSNLEKRLKSNIIKRKNLKKK